MLADEMGLGKTAQTVVTIHHIATALANRGPYLVIAPLSTLPHWQREFEGWTDLNVVLYHGDVESRRIIRQHEWHFENTKAAESYLFKFNVLITTYEMVNADHFYLSRIPWQYVVVDEAHRLKNKDCKLTEELRTFNTEHWLLLTGTPLQNNTEELWSLLNLMNPAEFHSLPDFQSNFGDLKNSAQVDKLHQLLKPILLRRMKDDVEKSLIPKEETIVNVELTALQQKYYRAIYERNLSVLTKGAKGSNMPNLINMVMELRKCCNHPYLVKGVEESCSAGISNPEESAQNLINHSGKLVLIDKLLPKLKANGHKVLVFSQMIRVLDILEDYLIHRQYVGRPKLASISPKPQTSQH